MLSGVKGLISELEVFEYLLTHRGPNTRQRFATATLISSHQIVVAVNGRPTHVATDLFNLSQFTLINLLTNLKIFIN